MGDPKGFLKYGRAKIPKRPVAERVQDYRWVYEPMPEGKLREQASRCMDCGVPFCNTGCPVNNLIPDWNHLVYKDHWKQAIDRLHRTNNFPEFTGILCPAPCETACVLSINDDPVTIKEIERSIIERAFEEGWVVPMPPPPPPEKRTGKRVAVVGSGPAGLAAAQQLNRAGHTVTVFEKDDRLGGLLRYGIPDYKMEKPVIDRRLGQLEAEGIEFHANAYVGEDPTAEELRREFGAIILAVGALQGADLDLPGRDLDGIHPAMDYLVQQNRRVAGLPVEGTEISAVGKKVVVLGGGDTSADCLGNANREAAASVKVLTHGTKPPETPGPFEWPDWPFILQTHPVYEEGGERSWSVTVTGFSGDNGRVSWMHLVEAEKGSDGRIRHRPGTEFEVDADLVLLAIGFAGPVRDRLLEDLGLEFGERGAIISDTSYGAGRPGVFVAGDARRGASLIVWAIAEGRKAARQADLYLTGDSLLPP